MNNNRIKIQFFFLYKRSMAILIFLISYVLSNDNVSYINQTLIFELTSAKTQLSHTKIGHSWHQKARWVDIKKVLNYYWGQPFNAAAATTHQWHETTFQCCCYSSILLLHGDDLSMLLLLINAAAAATHQFCCYTETTFQWHGDLGQPFNDTETTCQCCCYSSILKGNNCTDIFHERTIICLG